MTFLPFYKQVVSVEGVALYETPLSRPVIELVILCVPLYSEQNGGS